MENETYSKTIKIHLNEQYNSESTPKNNLVNKSNKQLKVLLKPEKHPSVVNTVLLAIIHFQMPVH